MPRAWLLALLAGALLAPLADAQAPVVPSTLSVSVEDPGRTMQPGRNESLVVRITYTPATGGQPAPGPDPSDERNSSQPTRVKLVPKTVPPWVTNVSFDPAEVLVEMPLGGLSTTYARLATAIVSIDPRAPALDRQEFIITATAEPNGNIQGSSSESPPIVLKPTFVARVNLTAPEAVIVPGGRWTDMPFTIKNLGNAETKVRLNVTARPQDSQVEFPQSVTIPRDGTEVVNVRLRIPWTYAEGGAVELEATPLTLDDEGRSAKADIEVLGQSAVPGVGPLALVALACLALLRRRT